MNQDIIKNIRNFIIKEKKNGKTLINYRVKSDPIKFFNEIGIKVGLEENKEIEVVVSDMHMPKMNGVEFIRTAKQEFSHIKFYILTGFDIIEEIEDALEEQLIHNYFRKPLDIEEMESSILGFLK